MYMFNFYQFINSLKKELTKLIKKLFLQLI